jgi:predicted dienelactone hydrolase
MTHTLNRRDWLAIAAGGLSGLAWPVQAANTRHAGQPAPLDGSWTDPTRQRAVPWRLRLPAAPSAGATAASWPLVVYSHGLGGSREGGALWGEAWAAAGVAVLHLEHEGSNTATLRAGLRQLRKAASAEQLRARVADVRFALDQVQRLADQARLPGRSDAPWAALRMDAIGVAGHSFGAHTTQAVAGQRFAVQAEVADPRPKAFIAFSPSSPAGERMGLQESFGAITRPFMAVTGSLDGDPLGSYDRGEPRAAVYDGLPPGQRALLWLDGADHMTFGGGRPGGVGTGTLRRRPAVAAERQAGHQALVAQITAAWWRLHLLGDPAARQVLLRPQGLTAKDRLVLG